MSLICAEWGGDACTLPPSWTNLLYIKNGLGFSHETLTILTKLPYKDFGTLKLEVLSIFKCANCNFSMPFIIYFEVFHGKKINASFFSTSWHDLKFKVTLTIRLDKRSWLVTSSTWLQNFVWNWFLVCKLNISHVNRVMTSCISSLVESCLWSKLQLHTIYGSWDSRGCVQRWCKRGSTHEWLKKIFLKSFKSRFSELCRY